MIFYFLVKNQETDLFEAIENALVHIDFNLKRNSDFINELTKLLDTSRAIQQEKHLKKLLKSLEEEKLNPPTSLNVPPVVLNPLNSQSQPSSPSLRPAGAASPASLKPQIDDKMTDEQRKKHKSRSFKGFLFLSNRRNFFATKKCHFMGKLFFLMFNCFIFF